MPEKEKALKNIINAMGNVFILNKFLNESSFLLLLLGTFNKNEKIKLIIPKSRLTKKY